MNRATKRKIINFIAMGMSLAAMLFGLAWLFWILWMVLSLGVGSFNLALFTEMTPPSDAHGGLKNAIAGSIIMVSLAMLIAIPVATLTGIYLAEYGQRSWLGKVTRFVNDILLSAPSIVIGLFVYAAYIAHGGKFSGFAGVLALALLAIPVMVRTTDNMLCLVPNTLREAAFALGASKWKVIMMVTLRAAKSGVVTGILLSVARISGETAPLLFTALSNQFWSVDLSKPMTSLPATILKFAMSPSANWQELAWAGVFLITLGVLLLNIIARVMFRNSEQR